MLKLPRRHNFLESSPTVVANLNSELSENSVNRMSDGWMCKNLSIKLRNC